MACGRRRMGNRYADSNIAGVSYLWVADGDVERAMIVDSALLPKLQQHTWWLLRNYVATRVGPLR